MNGFINPNLFLKFISDRLILWDYEHHRQYTLEVPCLLRIVEIGQSAGGWLEMSPFDDELIHSGIVSLKPFPADHWGWDPLAHIYHFGTRNIPQDPADYGHWAWSYITACEDISRHPFPERLGLTTPVTPVFLPAPELRSLENQGGFWEILKKRKTSRTFDRQVVCLQTVSTLMYASFGYVGKRSPDEFEYVPEFLRCRRTSPSGGGLNASDIYFIALNVSDLPVGIYFYNPTCHSFELTSDVDLNGKLGALLCEQYFADDLSFGVFIVARFDKMWWKYEHSRAYRVSLLDAGHLSQTFQLCATAIGLQTWITAAFIDNKIDQLLQLKNCAEQPILFVGGGLGSGDALDRARRRILDG